MNVLGRWLDVRKSVGLYGRDGEEFDIGESERESVQLRC